jgi:hypothetical protein
MLTIPGRLHWFAVRSPLTCFRPYGTDPDSPRVRKLIEGYDEHRFIDNEDEDVSFGKVRLFIRK